ncbi:lipopolysaccharide biosynthesis protein [Aquirufa novilacunae]|uniref:Polysaccharide biosynthesis protein n=1 Tax=Aquirufa novilacunae TaxID=3139305 RepID=A0ABW8U5F8_9BACT
MYFNLRHLNLFSSYFAIGFSALSSICIMYAINHYSGVAFYGDLMFYLSMSTILFTFFSFGTRETVTKILKYHDKDISVLLSGVILDLFSSFIIICIIYFFGEKILIFFQKYTANNLHISKLLAVYTVFFICQSSFIGFLKYYNKILIINLASIFQNIVNALIIGFYILNDNTTQSAIILAYVVSVFCGLLFLIFGVLIFLNFKFVKFSNKTFLNSFSKLYELSRLYFWASTGKIGVKNFENILLMKFLGSEAVGIYQTLLKILSPINLMTAPIGSNYQKIMIDYYHDNKYKKLKELIFRITKIVLMITILYIIIAMVFVDLYLDSQGIHNIEYSTILIFFLGVLSLLQSSTWWAGNFMICHFPQIPIFTNIISSILNILVPFYSLYYYGDKGMIVFLISIVMSQVPAYIVPFYLFRNYLKGEKSTII